MPGTVAYWVLHSINVIIEERQKKKKIKSFIPREEYRLSVLHNMPPLSKWFDSWFDPARHAQQSQWDLVNDLSRFARYGRRQGYVIKSFPLPACYRNSGYTWVSVYFIAHMGDTGHQFISKIKTQRCKMTYSRSHGLEWSGCKGYGVRGLNGSACCAILSWILTQEKRRKNLQELQRPTQCLIESQGLWLLNVILPSLTTHLIQSATEVGFSWRRDFSWFQGQRWIWCGGS